MNLKKKISLLLFISLFGGLLSTIAFNKPYIETKAANELKTLFFDLSLNDKFKKEGSSPYLSLKNNDKVESISLSLVKDDIYKTNKEINLEESSNLEVVIFDGSKDEYKSTYLDLNKLTISSYYNYICLDKYVINKKSEIKGYGCYQVRLPNPNEATYKTQRVWLSNDNQDFYSSDDWGEKAVNAVGYYEQDKWNIVTMSRILNSFDGAAYYYVDIPYSVYDLHFLRMANSVNHNYLIYNDYALSLSFGVCYFASISPLTELSYTVGNVRGASASTLAMVVESYLTYGKDASNGAVEMTMKNVFTTWFKDKSATSQDLKNTKIKDYTGYASNGNSYEGLEKNSEFSVNEKWNTMCSQVGIDPNTGEKRAINIKWFESESFRAILVIAGTALLVVAIITILIFIKRKKESAYR